MKVIKVVNQSNKVLVVLEDESIYISPNTWARNYIRKDMDISLDDYDRILKESHIDYLIGDSLKFLKSPKTIFETQIFLSKLDSINACYVINYLINKGYLNDEFYTKNFIDLNKNKKGPKLLYDELYNKGVSEEIINNELAFYTLKEEEKNIEKILDKYIKTYHFGSIASFKNKMMNMLLQKGFSLTIIQKMVEESAKILDNRIEEESILKDYDILYKKYQKKYSGKLLDFYVSKGLVNKGYSLSKINKVRGDLNESKED